MTATSAAARGIEGGRESELVLKRSRSHLLVRFRNDQKGRRRFS